MKKSSRIALLLLVAAVCVVYAPPRTKKKETDLIYLKGARRPTECTIQKDTYSYLMYSLGGEGSARMKWERIEKVVYVGMARPPYATAEKLFKEGDYEGAFRAYANTIRRLKDPWVPVYAGYKAGLCLFRLGRWKDAIKLFRLSMKTKDSHFEPDCLLMIGRCYLKLNNYGEAEKFLDAVSASKYPPGYKARADAVRIDIVYEKGDYKTALSRYGEVRDSIYEKDDPTRLSISIKIGTCYVKTGRREKGIAEFREVVSLAVAAGRRGKISAAEGDTLLAAAYRALGDAYFEAKDTERAVWAYLHTVLVYGHVGNGDVAHAAHYAAVGLFDLFGREQSVEVKRQMLAKMRELCARARRLYTSADDIRKVNEFLRRLPKKI